MTDDFEKELLAVFRDEVAGALDEILGLLDGWSSAPDRDAQRRLDAAFRTAHNVKGAARLAGFASVESLAHALEEALDRHRKAKTRPPDALLADLEIGMTMMVAFLEGEDLGPTMGQLESRLVSGLGPSQPGSEEAPGEPSEPARPPMGAFEVEPAIAAEAEAEAEIELEAGEAAAETQLGSGASAERSAERIGQAAPEMIRVHSAQLDRLMASSGDLLSHHARHTVRHGALESVGDGLQEALLRLAPEARRDFEAIGARLDTLIREDTNELQRLGYLTGELGDAVKSLRMLPLAGFVAQWRRIAVDAARDRGKRVRFEGDVGDFGLDRQVLDGLRDPMVHLLRNAVDHGIEAPEERESRGKAPIGTVSVRARTMGSMVEIDITDDGRGVDRQAVIARAIERGLLSPERAAKISEAEVLDLLFSPGFSTAGAVSRISGRGVGLDVVRTRVQELGGRAEIGENPGGGTLFRLTVPSSLVSTKGLLVKTGSTVHALPIAYVERTLRVALEDVRSVEGGAAVEQEGSEPLRLRWLATLMAESRQDDPERLAVVVVEHGRQRRGLVVGDVLGEAEFVVRQLPWNIRRLRGIAGAAVLGDGGLAVVIDVPSLFEGAASGRLAATETVKRKSEARKQRILVVDDSLTSRMLERNILLATGYDVEVANDGEEGWEALQRQEVDLLITDVEMPRLDGIELTRRVRADARLRELPIIMVTSLSRPEDVKAGAAAGADEYIVKGRFDHRALLDAVNRLI